MVEMTASPEVGLTWRQERLSLITCVSPGYDDELIRPWNAKATVKRREGKTFDQNAEAAISALRLFLRKSQEGADQDSRTLAAPPPIAAVAVTSFNEWGEGTQIEPASTKKKGEAGDGARAYPGYKQGNRFHYVEKVAEMSERWRATSTSLLQESIQLAVRGQQKDEL